MVPYCNYFVAEQKQPFSCIRDLAANSGRLQMDETRTQIHSSETMHHLLDAMQGTMRKKKKSLEVVGWFIIYGREQDLNLEDADR